MTTLIDQQIQALLDQYRAKAEANLGLLEEVLKAMADADRANDWMVRRIAAALHQHAAANQPQTQPQAPQVRPAGAPQPHHPPPWRQ